jgi:hypothetical protein
MQLVLVIFCMQLVLVIFCMQLVLVSTVQYCPPGTTTLKGDEYSTKTKIAKSFVRCCRDHQNT